MAYSSQTRPAPSFAINDLYDNLRKRAAEARRRRMERAGFREMMKLDDHLLHDIGVTRADVAYCAGLGEERDATQELLRRSSRTLRR